MKNIFAFTPEGTNPPYASLNEQDDGRVTLVVRSQFIDGIQTHAEMSIPDGALRRLAASLASYLDAKRLNTSTASFPASDDFSLTSVVDVKPSP